MFEAKSVYCERFEACFRTWKLKTVSIAVHFVVRRRLALRCLFNCCGRIDINRNIRIYSNHDNADKFGNWNIKFFVVHWYHENTNQCVACAIYRRFWHAFLYFSPFCLYCLLVFAFKLYVRLCCRATKNTIYYCKIYIDNEHAIQNINIFIHWHHYNTADIRNYVVRNRWYVLPIRCSYLFCWSAHFIVLTKTIT